ncbi:hypothetical protein DOY81_010258 [Sarcophaga bullata]|nr:hypothetical protein DOY81_010258 [Sarcophaga bullata]
MDSRGCGTTAELQVMVALRCWGGGENQNDAGFVKELRRVVKELEEQPLVMREFKLIKNFPEVIGAIYGTHIKIQRTGAILPNITLIIIKQD